MKTRDLHRNSCLLNLTFIFPFASLVANDHIEGNISRRLFVAVEQDDLDAIIAGRRIILPDDMLDGVLDRFAFFRIAVDIKQAAASRAAAVKNMPIGAKDVEVEVFAAIPNQGDLEFSVALYCDQAHAQICPAYSFIRR